MEINNIPHIFLDLDGVMCGTTQYYSNKKHWHPTYDCYRFDEKCVKILNEVLAVIDFPITIILSSDWKYHYSLEQMNDIFKWNNVKAVITDYTPSSWGVEFKSLQQLEQCRAYEIKKYVENHNVQYYVTIDDLDLAPWLPEGNFIRTPRANEGLKQSGIKNKLITTLKNFKNYEDKKD